MDSQIDVKEYNVNIENLTILRDYMVSRYSDIQYDEHFNMEYFALNIDDYDLRYGPKEVSESHACGTCCCLLGHGPLAGIKYSGTNWCRYSREKFGVDIDDQEELWGYLFSEKWSNNIQQAIKRLNYVIENGDVPEEFTNGNDDSYEWDYTL